VSNRIEWIGGQFARSNPERFTEMRTPARAFAWAGVGASMRAVRVARP
jgi:hypothetical protein